MQIGDYERAHAVATIALGSRPGGKLRPCPVEEPDALDQRRAAMGLEPFEEYERSFLSGFD